MLRGGSISCLRFALRRGIFAALPATSAAASAAAVAAAARLVLAALIRALGFRRAGRTRGFRRGGSFAVRLALARGTALAVLVGIAGRTFAARLIAARGAFASLFGGLVATLLGRVFTLRRGGLLTAFTAALAAASAAALPAADEALIPEMLEEPAAPAEDPMVEVCDVQFRSGSKVYIFAPGELKLATGDEVILETARGPEFGQCVRGNHMVHPREVTPPLRPILRLATQQDKRVHAENCRREKRAMDVCQQKIADLGLEMQLVSAEYAFDGSKVLFFFTADGRVDFRELV